MGKMLPLENKKSKGKILSHTDRVCACACACVCVWFFLEETSCNRKRKRDNMLGRWNVRSLYRAGSLTAAARYKLDLVGVQEVRWDKGGTV